MREKIVSSKMSEKIVLLPIGFGWVEQEALTFGFGYQNCSKPAQPDPLTPIYLYDINPKKIRVSIMKREYTKCDFSMKEAKWCSH